MDQLVEKNIGGVQSMDYQYNQRGWMTRINQPLGDYNENPLDSTCTKSVFIQS